MKLIRFLKLALLILPFSAFAVDGCPGNSYPSNGRCIYDSLINAEHFPMESAVTAPADLHSYPGNPLIINSPQPGVYAFGTVTGPLVIRSPSSIHVQSISEWPYVAAPLVLSVEESPPPGMPQTAPGMACKIYPMYPGVTLNCYCTKSPSPCS
jgi:hypothetical protein